MNIRGENKKPSREQQRLARARQKETGEPYTAALRKIMEAAPPPRPEWR